MEEDVAAAERVFLAVGGNVAEDDVLSTAVAAGETTLLRVLAWDDWPLRDVPQTLEVALFPERCGCLAVLMDAGVDVSPRGRDLLLRATERRAPACARLLVAAGAHEGPGASLLHRMVLKGDAEGYGFLLDVGLDPSRRDAEGETMLHTAGRATPGFMPIVVAAGVPVDARDDAGRTPLREAAQDGSEEGVARLLEAGADVTLRDGDGMTALSHARKTAHRGERRALVLRLTLEEARARRWGAPVR